MVALFIALVNVPQSLSLSLVSSETLSIFPGCIGKHSYCEHSLPSPELVVVCAGVALFLISKKLLVMFSYIRVDQKWEGTVTY